MTMTARRTSSNERTWTLFGLALASALPMLGGCASAGEDQLRARAAFDFNCPREQLSLIPLDDRTRGVEGCGKRATYVTTCDGPKNNALTRCTWVADSATTSSDHVAAQPGQPPPPPPPPPNAQ